MRANLDGFQCAVIFCLMMVSAIVYSTFNAFITFFHVHSLLDLFTEIVCAVFSVSKQEFCRNIIFYFVGQNEKRRIGFEKALTFSKRYGTVKSYKSYKSSMI